jgi:tRNA pseudouridine55 synthase
LSKVSLVRLRLVSSFQSYTNDPSALNKPTGITSAGAIRELQKEFDKSKLFEPWIETQKATMARESHNQQRKRRKAKNVSVKTGHGGTLDPMATGVLTIGVGKGTKVLQSFIECTKTYDAVILFGAQTDTYDREGKILKRGPYKHITRDMVEKALEQFRGNIMQLPPLYSALKMNGKPLYEYAREGKELPREIQKRAVEVKELEMLEFMPGGTHEHKLPTEEAGSAEIDVAEKLWKLEKDQEKDAEDPALPLSVRKRKLEEEQDGLVTESPAEKRRKSVSAEDQEAKMSGALSTDSAVDAPTADAPDAGPPAAKLRMTVTSGFYVRSLCHDLGEAVGSQAIMVELIRTRQGQFELGKNVLEYEDFKQGEDVWGPKLEIILDEWSGEYRPFAGSSAENNNSAIETPAAAAESVMESVETVEPAAAAKPVPAAGVASPATASA